jgi:uncharacterized protein
VKPEPVAQAAFALEPGDRFDSIDILRGLALFGVLAVNLVTEFRVSIFQQFLPAQDHGGWAAAFVHNVLEMKAFAVFSLLFGFGLALQYDRFSVNDRPRYRLARRLLVLLAFGLIHLLLIWNGDILTEYALAGLLVLPLLAAPGWGLATTSALCFFVYLTLPLLPPLVSWPETPWIEAHVAQAGDVLGAGTLSEVLGFNLRELPELLPLHVWVLPRTLGLFLLGAFIWRAGIVQRMHALRLEVAAVSMACLGSGVLAFSSSWRDASTVLLALGFAGAVIVVLEQQGVRRALRAFAAIGRMAFSNYIMQSLICGWIFYGYGLGQFGRMDAAQALALASGIYAFQLALSHWWLRHYRFGPLEWLWRTLTYGRTQPMKRSPAAHPAQGSG